MSNVISDVVLEPALLRMDEIPDDSLRIRFQGMVATHKRTLSIVLAKLSKLQRMGTVSLRALQLAQQKGNDTTVDGLLARVVLFNLITLPIDVNGAIPDTLLNYFYAPNFGGSYSRAQHGKFWTGPYVTVFGQAHLESDALYRDSIALHEALHIVTGSIRVSEKTNREQEATGSHDKFFVALEKRLNREMLGAELTFGTVQEPQPWYVRKIHRDGILVWNDEELARKRKLSDIGEIKLLMKLNTLDARMLGWDDVKKPDERGLIEMIMGKQTS